MPDRHPGHQLFDVQLFRHRREVALHGIGKPEGASGQGVYHHAIYPDDVFRSRELLPGLQHFDFGFDQFKLRSFTRPDPRLDDPRHTLDDLKILSSEGGILLSEQQIIKRYLHLGLQIQAGFRQAGRCRGHSAVRYPLSSRSQRRPFQRLSDGHVVLGERLTIE